MKFGSGNAPNGDARSGPTLELRVADRDRVGGVCDSRRVKDRTDPRVLVGRDDELSVSRGCCGWGEDAMLT